MQKVDRSYDLAYAQSYYRVMEIYQTLSDLHQLQLEMRKKREERPSGRSKETGAQAEVMEHISVTYKS